MRNFILAAAAVFSGMFTANAQDVQGVEKSMFNIQAGATGVWVSHEGRLGNEFALRTEIGIDLWTFTSSNDNDYNYMLPSITLEPRWYYNIEKRAEKGKYTANNSANFLTVSVEYLSGGLGIGKDNGLDLPEILTVIPKWGIRRAISKSNFNYELGAGLGYQAYIANNDDMKSDSDVGFDLHVRFGYTF